MSFRLTVDDDGSISKLVIGRSWFYVDEAGNQIDAGFDGGAEVPDRIENGESIRRIVTGEPITSVYLRRLKFGELVDEAKSSLDWFCTMSNSDLDWVSEMSNGRGRKPFDDRFYAEIARRTSRLRCPGRGARRKISLKGSTRRRRR